jgi:hypothetical protein
MKTLSQNLSETDAWQASVDNLSDSVEKLFSIDI